MEFHVSRQARDRYQFDQDMFTISGNVIFADFRAARAFAQKMNQKKDLVTNPEQSVRAGSLNALGMIHEILHHVLGMYRQQQSPTVMAQALDALKEKIGKREVERTLVLFATEFPPRAVYEGQLSLAEYYAGSTDGLPNEQVLLEEMLMLWVTNKNPASEMFEELFDDDSLSQDSSYSQIIAELHRFFDTQPPFGPEASNLIDMLRAPAIEIPYSLFGQLAYIRERWAELLGVYLRRLLSSMDLIREEEAQRGFGGGGGGPVAVPVYDQAQRELLETENFSPDREWMPRLVLIAKNTYVWLDQLSKEYQRSINRLDQIPDEELEKLARWGFTGLWLIGLWERSIASATIKQIMGNPEAIASAYSLHDYYIANDLGGEEAYQRLREKAWRYGIRLASDMVPNHMAIDSSWVADHPDWFVQLNYSPYPGYSFNGPDLTRDSRVSIQLEDHYYDRSDAAVVFKLYDHRDGQERYIYHGNDGTSMPWNDTAQLNYLLPEVREAVIQTILAVARRFPVIRFDAAMTLAKMHFERLWFPLPGSGGAIPSRSEHALTKEEFEARLPVEFWREVVDRVAQEVPDTLLLAEAFWLMEGYFVRSLGMHRVYNSAFMNLARNEENGKYRLLMKNTLEFDPEILKRYVNFMNNPDERTSVDQFGKGDKYFGIATLMSTMPGLPMFGHGQVEGYSEKYGMEFRRAYWDEKPDPELVDRHARQIFPLFHRRAVFAGVDEFLLYDFFTEQGGVNEDVYAYSNGLGGERGLVVYNNRFAETSGWIRTSVGYSVKSPDGSRYIIQRTLGEGLNLHPEPNTYVIFRDLITGLERIQPSQEVIEKGMFFALGAYECHVFLDFREVVDDQWGSYRRLHEYLGQRGVPGIQQALQELLLQPVLSPYRQLVNPGYFHYLLDARLMTAEQVLPAGLLEEAALKMEHLIDGIAYLTGGVENREHVIQNFSTGLRLALALPSFAERYVFPGAKRTALAIRALTRPPVDEREWVLLLGWFINRHLGRLRAESGSELQAVSWVEEWQFTRVLQETGRALGLSSAAVDEIGSLHRVLIAYQSWFTKMGKQTLPEVFEGWLADPDVQVYLNINRYQDVLWFNKERFDNLTHWLLLMAVFDQPAAGKLSSSWLLERLLLAYPLIEKLQKAGDACGYQVDKLLKALT
jgi:glycosidase